MTLNLSQAVYDKLAAHLTAAYPDEGAGLLLGNIDGSARYVHDILTFENSFETGEQYHRYLLTAENMMKAEDAAEARGLDVLGVFHSHPNHPAIASEYDREYALPWYSYLIISVREGKPTVARSWQLADDRSHMDEENVHIHTD